MNKNIKMKIRNKMKLKERISMKQSQESNLRTQKNNSLQKGVLNEASEMDVSKYQKEIQNIIR